MTSPAARRHGGGGGGTIPAGLRLSTVGIYLVEELGNRKLARGLVSLGLYSSSIYRREGGRGSLPRVSPRSRPNQGKEESNPLPTRKWIHITKEKYSFLSPPFFPLGHMCPYGVGSPAH